MKRINEILCGLVLLMWCAITQAQEVSPVDFMRMNPYQMKSNPATDLPYESVMSIMVGNIGMSIQCPTLHYDNLFEFDTQGQPVSINLTKFANSLKENNFTGFDASVDLFTLYRRINNGMITFNYGLKAQGDAQFNDGLFKLAAYGNSAFVGNDHPAQVSLDVNAQVYQEFAVGYQLNVTGKLSLGGRAKLLFGLADIETDAFDVKLFTDPDSYALRLEENIAMRMALPKTVYANDGQLMTNGFFNIGQLFRNSGFGVDLAAEYRFNERFSAVAAVQDLGFIHWGLNNIEMKGQINDAGQFYDDGSFLFEGMDVDQLQRVFGDELYREQFLDTLRQYFDVDFSMAEAYTTMLNTGVLLRGNFDVNPSNRFSAQLHGRFLGSGFRPAMTLAYNGSFFRMLDVCATYTIMPNSYDNIGLGLAGNFGMFHIYLTTNNVVGLFKPLNASGFNVQAGIVFNLRLPEQRLEKEAEQSKN